VLAGRYMIRSVLGIASMTITLTGCLSFGMEVPVDPSLYSLDPPVVVHSTPESITVWYDKDRSDPLHDQAEQLVKEHCGGPYTIQRTDLKGSHTIEATCD